MGRETTARIQAAIDAMLVERPGRDDVGDVYQIADRLDTPIILADEWITRRQRVHAVVWPGSVNSYTSNSMVVVLNHLVQTGCSQAIMLERLQYERVSGIVINVSK